MTEDIIECYETLGLDPGASPESVKEAYRDMAKVWHPDRFAGDERLARKAQDKLREINTAYERLQAYFADSQDSLDGVTVLPARRPARPTSEAPPVALPFPDLGRTVAGAVALVAALGIIGVMVIVMSMAESRRASSEQALQEAELEARRIRAEAEAERRAQAEALAIAERERQAAITRQKSAEKRVRQLEAAQRDPVAERTLAQARQELVDAQAQAGEVEQHYQVALSFAQGRGGKRDDEEAVKWFRKAAEQGHRSAQHHLAFMYGQGRGVEKDMVEAYKWFTLAARQGEEGAINNLEMFAARMTPEQVAEGRRRALEFLEQHDMPAP